MRVAEDAMAPRVRAGDYVWVDPDEPAADGSLVAVRDPGRGGETVVRLLIERDGRRILRALHAQVAEPRPKTPDVDLGLQLPGPASGRSTTPCENCRNPRLRPPGAAGRPGAPLTRR